MNIIMENVQIPLKGLGRFKRQLGQLEKDSLTKINFKTTSFKKKLDEKILD